MSEGTRATGTDARVDEQRAYEGDAERRDVDVEPARRDDTVTSDPDRPAAAGSTGYDDVPGDATQRDPAVDDSRAEAAAGAHDIGRDPSSERRGPTAGPDTSTQWGEGLLRDEDRSGYQQRWDEIQVRFIDEPRESVRQADDLVDEVTTRIAERFSSARREMEQRWEGGDEPTTEELRQAVQRYRDFFQRLVAQEPQV